MESGRRRPAGRARTPVLHSSNLLHLDCRSSVGEFLLDGFRLFLGNTLFNGLRGAVDQVLGFLQTQAGDFSDRLDYIDLIGAHFLQDDAKFGLLLRRSRRRRRSSTAGHHHRGRGRRRDAELLFQALYELRCIEQRQSDNLIFQLLQIRHVYISKFSVET